MIGDIVRPWILRQSGQKLLRVQCKRATVLCPPLLHLLPFLLLLHLYSRRPQVQRVHGPCRPMVSPSKHRLPLCWPGGHPRALWRNRLLRVSPKVVPSHKANMGTARQFFFDGARVVWATFPSPCRTHTVATAVEPHRQGGVRRIGHIDVLIWLKVENVLNPLPKSLRALHGSGAWLGLRTCSPTLLKRET